MNKIMIIGNFQWNIYEEALSSGFTSLGINVISFKIKHFSLIEKIKSFYLIYKINKDLISKVEEEKPDAIFLYRCNELLPSTLNKVRQKKIKILIYHNDNPYIKNKDKIKKFLFLNAIKYSNLAYAYRPSNLEHLEALGAKRTKLLYPHFYSKNDLISTTNMSEKDKDVIFIGHYEENRAKTINYLIKNGINVKIFGSKEQWSNAVTNYAWDDSVIQKPVYGLEYRNTISTSKLALCFLSRINKDVYTRRNFEIPAAGTLCVSEHTYELETIFENNEIILFKSDEELLEKINFLFKNENIIEEYTKNVHNKMINGFHSEKERAFQILEDIKEL